MRKSRSHSSNATGFWLGLSLLLSLALACLLVLAGVAASSTTSHRQGLTFAERVVYQTAIEEVYHRHRTWPKENPNPKPPLANILPLAAIEDKVRDYLRQSAALDVHFQSPITAEQLQQEVERMAVSTRKPEMLHEIFAALDNDPLVIAECLARPHLAERLIRDAFATFEQPKLGAGQTFDDWWQQEREQASEVAVAAQGLELEASYRSVVINAAADCTVDTWSQTRANPPRGRSFHTAVWTGAEMIVWGGRDSVNNYLASGGRYNPATDSWHQTGGFLSATSRSQHTAVWTGTEMIVWGGARFSADSPIVATGGRFNPVTSEWKPTTIVNAPAARRQHTAVWTGTEMIVWGGTDDVSYLNSGGRYNPQADSWTVTSAVNAPSARIDHTALWTGAEMIIWGGADAAGLTAAGGRYNPSTNNWQPTSTMNAAAARQLHTAVWSGAEMIVWGGSAAGGEYVVTGGRYNPASNSWQSTSVSNAPEGRIYATAVWTGAEMIVWGGSTASGEYVMTGSRYHPATNTWQLTNGNGAPAGRLYATAVWSGTEMIVWGGLDATGRRLNTGGRYNPATNSWRATSLGEDVPVARIHHSAVWTGAEMIVWGGEAFAGMNTIALQSGGRYDPATDTWTPTNALAPEGRSNHTAVWAGSEMIVWGGYSRREGAGVALNTGGRYDPAANVWRETSIGTNLPTKRKDHQALWTGAEMLVWGGSDGTSILNTGGRYNPSTDSWTPMQTVNAPSPRLSNTAVWTGAEMIVWGGNDGNKHVNTGGRYNPQTDAWTPTSTGANSLAPRENHTAVWTGAEMIVWGGYSSENVGTYFNTGGRYDPQSDTWRPTSALAPTARGTHRAVWTGAEMIVWGGYGGVITLSTGGKYDPKEDVWRPTNQVNVPSTRSFHTAVWTGSEMIIWGGADGSDGIVNTGGRYCAAAGPPSAAGLRITSVTAVGKKLFILGQGFDLGAKLFLDDTKQKTVNDDLDPQGRLVCKKAGLWVAPGQTVKLKVRNADGTESPEFIYTRP